MKIRDIYKKLKKKHSDLRWIIFTDKDEVELVFETHNGEEGWLKEEFERDSETYKLMAKLEKALRTR